MAKPDRATLLARFNRKFKIDPVSGCWNWTAGLGSKEKYPYMSDGYTMKRAARMAYIWENGNPPTGTELHHSCDNKLCVNPNHVTPLTPKQHAATKKMATKRFCVRGHEFTPKNTARNTRGQRVCRKCCVIRNTAFRRARRLQNV